MGTSRLHILRRLIVAGLFASATLAAAPALAGEAKRAPAQRQKTIDFEESLVEGMNKKPLDSLNQLSDADRRRRKSHLYKKREEFRAEAAQTLRELRYSQ